MESDERLGLRLDAVSLGGRAVLFGKTVSILLLAVVGRGTLARSGAWRWPILELFTCFEAVFRVDKVVDLFAVVMLVVTRFNRLKLEG